MFLKQSRRDARRSRDYLTFFTVVLNFAKMYAGAYKIKVIKQHNVTYL